MVSPTIKEPTDLDPGDATKWGAPDAVHCSQLLKGTHASEKIQKEAIENTALTLSDVQTVSGAKTFLSTKFIIRNAGNSKSYTFVGGAIVNDYNITLPTLVASDIMVCEAHDQPLSNKTLTAPKFVDGGYLADDSGNEWLKFSKTATAVNEITIKNNSTGLWPQIKASGETNVGLLLAGKGTGKIQIADGADLTKILTIELVGALTGKTVTIVSAHQDDRTITLPDATTTLVGTDIAQTLSLKTLTAPKIANAGYIADANGNELLICTTTGSAVNELTLANAATGGNPTLTASGGDTNVGFQFIPKGAGFGFGFIETMEVALSDDAATSAPTTGVKYTSLPMQADFKIIGLPVGGVKTTGSGGTLVEFDILVEDSVNANTFTTIFSTRPTIDAGEYTTTTGATPCALSSTPTTVAKGKRIQFKIHAIDSGNAARGYKLGLRGYYSAA